MRNCNARRIVKIFHENLVNARLTPFNKRRKFRRTRKSDTESYREAATKLTTLLTSLTTNAITSQKSNI